jgi:hypothetical protein
VDLRITAVATGTDGTAVTASVTVAVNVPEPEDEGPVRRMLHEAAENLREHLDGR